MACYNELVEHIYQRGFYLIDNFLSHKAVASLQETALALIAANQFQPAKIGRHTTINNNRQIRGDTIYWLDNDTNHHALAAFFMQTKHITKALNQQLFLGLTDFEAHFAFYQPGSFYKRHVDQFNNQRDRRLSCVYYLNNDWHESFGGQLHLYNKQLMPLIKIMPVANRFVCFSSDLPHEVSQTTMPRLSITGWMKTRSIMGSEF